MKHRKKIATVLITLSCLILIMNWYACSNQEAPVENAQYEKERKLLLELGEIRLRLVSRFDESQSHFIFNHRQMIREWGFDPVWRDGRYILKDLETREKIDPFRLKQERGHRPPQRKHLILGSSGEKSVREAVLQVDRTLHMPDGLVADIYEHQLYGFHLVVRRCGLFGCKSKLIYVKDMQNDDLKIEFDELFLLNEALAYNGCVFYAPNFNDVYRSEERLRDWGYIMKKRGDGYVPVMLETGSVPEWPPREFFVDETVSRINDSKGVIDPALRRVPFFDGSRSPVVVRPLWLEKELLDLYEVEILWNNAEQQHEVVK